MREEMAFGSGDYVVYPTHGVGKVIGIESRGKSQDKNCNSSSSPSIATE